MTCEQGLTTRLTFSDGTVFESDKSPLTVECTNECAISTVFFRAGIRKFAYNNGIENIYYDEIEEVELQNSFYGPTGEMYITDYPYNIYIMSRGNSWLNYCSDYGETLASALPPGRRNKYEWVQKISESVVSIAIVKDSLGNVLFEKPGGCYPLEECIGCPPNFLDCGDCCLDCVSTFNSISAIRRIIRGLR